MQGSDEFRNEIEVEENEPYRQVIAVCGILRINNTDGFFINSKDSTIVLLLYRVRCYSLLAFSTLDLRLRIK